MRRVIIIHGWEGFPEKCWYPKVKKDLHDLGLEVTVPQMPDTDHPKLSHWLTKLQEVAANLNEELFLIGHSAGCITILRFLEQLKENEKVGGVILVAGFSENLGKDYEELNSFFENPLDFEKIKTKSKNFVAIHSDNDMRVPAKFGDIFKEKLGAKLIVLHNMDHFSSNPRNISSLPEVTQEILRMSASSAIIAS
ncbi:MAG TPA: alpha/beta hydrolase [Candidatus Saccharimonadales bacterium]|nr:alpha/beta hydrolase [Candidatus Saccharimonadales bacterium]